MTLVFTIIALVGLIIFAVFAILHLVGPVPRRALWWTVAVVGLLIWAVASIVLILDSLL